MRIKHRIIIAEDHTILREGLKALLMAEDGFEVIGEAGDGLEAIRLVEEMEPDLVLMDLSMPRMSGVGAIGEIKRRSPSTRVLALTVHDAEEYILAALKAGADGYVLKDASRDELIMALRSVLAGKRFLSPGVSKKVIEGFIGARETDGQKSPWDMLTPRERVILKLVAEGQKNRQIADYLCISDKTVAKHRANLMRKLDLHSVAELTAYAMERGLVTRQGS